MTDKSVMRRYAEAVDLWVRKFDTAFIAETLKVPEPIVCRWVWNFREQARMCA